MRRTREVTSETTTDLFREARADYNAAKTSRFRASPTGVSPSGSSADYHYRSEYDYLRMVERARFDFRNNAYVAQAVRRLVDNVVQQGFTCDPDTGSDEANDILTQRWAAWSEDPDKCDVSGRFTFRAMERLVYQHTIVDGDHLVLLLSNGSLQLTEGHRLRTPSNTKLNVVNGVLLDQYRKPVEYWLTKDDIDPSRSFSRVSDARKVPARDRNGNRNVLHVYRPDRATQSRGVTAFAPFTDIMSMWDDLNFAMLVKAQHASVYAILRERTPGAPSGPVGNEIGDTTDTAADGTTRVLHGMAPGVEVTGREGESLKGFSPNIPNPEFFAHAKMLLNCMSVNLGMPVAMFLLDPSETNFSGWRGAMDQARTGFRREQKGLIETFHSPVYRFKIREWTAEDPKLQSFSQRGVDLFRHKWNPPGWQYIEPLKDAAGDLLRVRNALISQRRRAAERGIDWRDLATEIVEDNAMLIEKAHVTATSLNEKYEGLSVTWREIASLPTPDGVNITVKDTEPLGSLPEPDNE